MPHSISRYHHTDQEKIDALAAMGIRYVLLPHGSKAPQERNWQSRPHNATTASAHFARGGNLGALAGRKSGGVVWLDLDAGFDRFLQTFPPLQSSLISYRDDARGRGKIAVRVTGGTLPASTAWRPDREGPPRAELLANGRQAAILGMHPSGAPYKLRGDSIIALTFGELNAIWRQWTGEPLRDPTRTTATTATTAATATQTTGEATTDTLRGRVKARWTAYSVFERFGFTREVERERNGDLRLRGHGGLIVGDPESDRAWQWYCHAEGLGGDQIDAWAWCTTGTITNRATFAATLHAMADAAGIVAPVTTLEMQTADGEIVSMQFRRGIDVIRASLAELDAYPDYVDILGRPLTQRRRIDRAAMLAVLARMRAAGTITAVKISVRSLADSLNVSKNTAAAALRRLVKQGKLMRERGTPWYDGELLKHDAHVRNRFDAVAFTLPPQVCKIDTGNFSSVGFPGTGPFDDGPASATAPEEHSVSILHTSLQTLHEYTDHDAFAHGARDAGDDDAPSLGRGALDLLAALDANNDLTYADLAEETGMSRSSASRKARALAHYGLVEIYRDGRTCYVYLRDNWRDILESVWQRLTTFAVSLRRRVGHLGERIRRAEDAVYIVDSGRLSVALGALLLSLRRRLRDLNRQIAALESLRAGEGGRTELRAAMAADWRASQTAQLRGVRSLGAAIAEYNG